MKILHTADWHLGHKLYNANREAEHQTALDGLLNIIEQEQVELLIIAGDVFDTDMPPNYARKQYYSFLKRLVGSSCENVVVVAGNHDSANMLDASSEILSLLNVHVVGNLPSNREEQIIQIKNTKNELRAVVAAVPYLRDRDVRVGVPGQSIEERLQRLREGIEQHYAEVEEALAPYQKQEVPLICTGHLYVSGGERDGRPNSIHIGSLDVVDVSCFPPSADYVALGHLHRPQKVAGLHHVRYAGSLIPMDFNEWNYTQQVLLLEFEQRELLNVKTIEVPLSRKLKFYRGTIDYIKEKLEQLDCDTKLPVWLKLEVLTESFLPDLEEQLQELLEAKAAEIMILNQMAPNQNSMLEQANQQMQSLSELEPIEVFNMRLDMANIIASETRADLSATFQELLSWMQDKDQE